MVDGDKLMGSQGHMSLAFKIEIYSAHHPRYMHTSSKSSFYYTPDDAQYSVYNIQTSPDGEQMRHDS